MKVLALLPYPLGIAPGQRYRIEQWAPYLAQEGIEVTLSPFADHELVSVLHQRGRTFRKVEGLASAWLARMAESWTATDFDVLFIHREASLIGPALAERVALRRGGRMVYDFDDAVYLRYVSPTNRFFSYLKFPSKTGVLCRTASAVLVGNSTLADYAHQYNDAIHVVPSTVSLREYQPRSKDRPEGRPVIGWTGSHSSAAYLSLVSDALRRVHRKVPFRFLIIGVEGFSIAGIETECRPWRSVSEVDDLWDIDVGIMPLTDDPWSRGKCGMKAIQYMGVGVPPVVSPVGANRQIVTHGVDGLHASHEEEWVDALSQLLQDEPLRRRLGTAAWSTVKERYSAEAQVPHVAQILRSVGPATRPTDSRSLSPANHR